jgi:hypothetical protein
VIYYAVNNLSGGYQIPTGHNHQTRTKTDLKPYDIVYNTLIVGKKRIEAVEGYNLKCRPYIQGFTASYLPDGYWMEYGAEQYRAQIKAVYDAGYEEWIFWNARSEYVEEAFLPEGEE